MQRKTSNNSFKIFIFYTTFEHTKYTCGHSCYVIPLYCSPAIAICECVM